MNQVSTAHSSPPEADDARLCVVIVTYNSADVLPGLLDTIEPGMSGLQGYEVVVVDNRSEDGSADIARAHPTAPHVIDMGYNAGYAAAINAASAWAEPGSALLILNPDIRLFEGSVAPLLARGLDAHVGVAVPCNLKADGSVDPTLRRDPSVVTAWSEAMLGGRLASRWGLGEVVADGYGRRQEIAWATGSALLVSAQARSAVGLWDESYFLYSEEVDFQKRVREAGLRIEYIPEAKVTHFCGPYRRNPRLYALLTSNRIRYFNRRNGRLSAFLFRLGIAVGEGLRAPLDPIHRAALACAILPLKPALHFRAKA